MYLQAFTLWTNCPPRPPISKYFREVSIIPLVVIRSPKALTFLDQAQGIFSIEGQSSHRDRDPSITVIFSLRQTLQSERLMFKLSSYLTINKILISLLSDRNNVSRIDKGAGEPNS